MLKSLAFNTGSNITLFVFKLVLTFLMSPILVRNLGNHDYGVWELIIVSIGYMGILDLGIRPSVSRFTSYYQAKNDFDSLLDIFSTSLFYMFLLGLGSLVIFVCAGFQWADQIAEYQASSTRYKWLLFIIGIQVLIVFPGQVTESVLEGMHKFYVKNNVTIVISVITNIVIFNLITRDNALILLAVASTIGDAIKYTVLYVMLRLNRGRPVYFTPARVKWSVLREALSFGAKSFLSGAALTLQQTASSIIITAIVGVNKIIYFSIPSRLMDFAWSFLSVLSQACMPLFAKLHGESKDEAIRETFFVLSKYIYAITVLLCIGLLMVGDDFLAIWMGQEYAVKGRIILTCTTLASLFNAINPLAGRYLTAINRHGVLAISQTVQTIVRAVAMIPLVYYFDYVGAAYASFISILFTFYILRHTCSCLETPVVDYLKIIVLPVLLPALALFAYLVRVTEEYTVDSYTRLLLVSITGGMIYVGSYVLISTNKKEKLLMKSMVISKT